MAKWEYHTGFLWAEADMQKEYLKQRWPQTEFAKYTPYSLIPALDKFGEDGWELISMEPVHVGQNADIRIQIVGEHSNRGDVWVHTYFCVFKRQREG